jgi:hypothetical protein
MKFSRYSISFNSDGTRSYSVEGRPASRQEIKQIEKLSRLPDIKANSLKTAQPQPKEKRSKNFGYAFKTNNAEEFQKFTAIMKTLTRHNSSQKLSKLFDQLDEQRIRLVDLQGADYSAVPIAPKISWNEPQSKGTDRVAPVLNFVKGELGEHEGTEYFRKLDLLGFCRIEDSLKKGEKPDLKTQDKHDSAPGRNADGSGVPPLPRINWK